MPKDQPSGQKWQPPKINTYIEAHSQKQVIRQPQNRNILINIHTQTTGQPSDVTQVSTAMPNKGERSTAQHCPHTPPRG